MISPVCWRSPTLTRMPCLWASFWPDSPPPAGEESHSGLRGHALLFPRVGNAPAGGVWRSFSLYSPSRRKILTFLCCLRPPPSSQGRGTAPGRETSRLWPLCEGTDTLFPDCGDWYRTGGPPSTTSTIPKIWSCFYNTDSPSLSAYGVSLGQSGLGPAGNGGAFRV